LITVKINWSDKITSKGPIPFRVQIAKDNDTRATFPNYVVYK